MRWLLPRICASLEGRQADQAPAAPGSGREAPARKVTASCGHPEAFFEGLLRRDLRQSSPHLPSRRLLRPAALRAWRPAPAGSWPPPPLLTRAGGDGPSSASGFARSRLRSTSKYASARLPPHRFGRRSISLACTDSREESLRFSPLHGKGLDNTGGGYRISSSLDLAIRWWGRALFSRRVP